MKYRLICLDRVLLDSYLFVIFCFLNIFIKLWSELMFGIVCFWVCRVQYSHCWQISLALSSSFIFSLNCLLKDMRVFEPFLSLPHLVD